MTKLSEETQEAAGRGRPRPDATVERDARVLAFLNEKGPASRKVIAEGLEIGGNEVYLSLYRLSRADKIKREGAAWSVVGAEVPVEQPA